jgi:hypothetical protein
MDYICVCHPKVWNGGWFIKPHHRFSHFFRWLGHRLHSRRIYWIGLPIRWEVGLKDIIDDKDKWRWYGEEILDISETQKEMK